MRRLLHLWLCPYSRKVRIVLKEKGLDFDLEVEKVWERRPDFLALNPAGQVPVLVEHDGRILAESTPICEYLDEVYPGRSGTGADMVGQPKANLLVGFDPTGRAETRRLVNWFDLKLGPEATLPLVHEKLMKRVMGDGGPDSQVIRVAQHNLHVHLDYISYLAERRKYLSGDDFSLADVAAAAHLSCLDYLGAVPWTDYAEAKDWYARVKSRPSFKPLLGDHIPGLPPPRHYADLDF